MSQERLMAAIARIDTALARIEDAAARPAAAPADAALEDRHARLRAATTAAIQRLDALIGTDGSAGDVGVVV